MYVCMYEVKVEEEQERKLLLLIIKRNEYKYSMLVIERINECVCALIVAKEFIFYFFYCL